MTLSVSLKRTLSRRRFRTLLITHDNMAKNKAAQGMYANNGSTKSKNGGEGNVNPAGADKDKDVKSNNNVQAAQAANPEMQFDGGINKWGVGHK